MAKAKVKFTPHQQQAVDIRGGNILVSAAAGSGKTAVLTERALQLLTGEQAIPADRLVVVTFTVAAADEMRRRIADKLSDRISEDPTNEWLQSQQLLLPSARISTIHSLCNTLIKENAQSLGLSADVRIAEENDLAVLQNEALLELFEQKYTGQDEAFLHLIEFTCVKSDKPLLQLVLAVYDFIRSFAFPLSYLDKVEAMYASADSMSDSVWGKSVQEYLVSALEFCERSLGACIREIQSVPAVSEKYLAAFVSDREQITQLRILVEQGKMGGASLAAAGLQKAKLSAVRGYGDPAFLESLQNRRKKAYSILDELVKRFLNGSDVEFREDITVLSSRIHTLFALVRTVYEEIENRKHEKNIIDYSDLEHFALSLLVEPTDDGGWTRSERAGELSETIDQIMIDECQDINEVQNLIFTLLSRNGSNLYMVGDVKQSIYRFRKAMPDLFIQKRKSFLPFGQAPHTDASQETITLEMNFRSRREVCQAVNFVFSNLMSGDVGEIEYTSEEALVPGAAFPDYTEAVPEIHILDYDRTAEEGKTVAEARYIAAQIKNMLEGCYQVSDGQGGLRRCRFRDFAILLRSYREKGPIYARELTAAGVSCYCDTSEGYFESYEVMVLLNLLRVIDNPLQDVALLSVLFSPLLGFSADKITEIRLAHRGVPFYAALLELGEKGDSICTGFLNMLRTFRQTAATSRVDTLIQEIYDRTDFLSIASVMADGGDKNANLRLMLNYAANYEALGANGLSGFLRYVGRVIQAGGDFSAASAKPENADSVRIMSIHKSKGLEFPICIVADCAKKFNKADLNARYQMNGVLGVALKITDAQTLRSYASLPFEAIRLKTERETISEEMRVLYVAMTRAKEKLMLVMTIPNAENRLRSIAEQYSGAAGKPSPYQVFRAQGYDEWLLSVFLFHPGFAEVRSKIGREDIPVLDAGFPARGILAGAVPAEQVEPQERVFHAEPPQELNDYLHRAICYEYPWEPLTHIPAKLTVTQIAKQEQAAAAPNGAIHLEKRPSFLQRKAGGGFTPAERGTILHSFMQFADYAAAEADLENEINRLISQKFLSSEEARALNRPKIQAFLRSGLYGRMKAAGSVLREYKFLYYIRAGEVTELPEQFAGEEILIQGIADCLIFEENQLTIVDYKTDFTDNPQTLAERYYDQLRIYRDAMEQAFGISVRQCLLYSLHLEREIEIPLPR